MSRLISILASLAAICMFCLAGCGVAKPTIGHTSSSRLEIRERLVFVHDTAKFTIPQIREVNRTRDTSSHLENDYAKSDARIENGHLYHDLESKPQTIYVPFEVPVHVHDTTYVESEKETEYVPVEKELTWQQRSLIALGKVLLVLMLASATFLVARRCLRHSR